MYPRSVTCSWDGFNACDREEGQEGRGARELEKSGLGRSRRLLPAINSGFFGADFFSGSLATRDEMDYKHDDRDEKQNVDGEAGYVIHHEGADPDEEKD
jgi:hypothetical protein